MKLIILHKRPVNQSRWNLPLLQKASQDLLGNVSISGLHGILKKMGITCQRARPYIHSPDKKYQEKLVYLCQIIALAKRKGIEILFEDEFTLVNQASSAADYAPRGQQPKEQWAYSEKTVRIAGALNALNGKTTI